MKAYKITGKLGDICSFVGGNEVKKGDRVYFHSESDMKQQCVAKTQENDMSIEAMKQALEALKRLKAYGNVFRFRQDEQNPYDQACEAIESLRQAIANEALNRMAENEQDLGIQMKRCDCAAHSAVECVCGAWDKPVAQQAEKQQPFGYLWPTGRHPEFRFTQQLRDGVEGTPVYTTPLNPLDSIKSSKTLGAQPRREWVGLTDEEIKKFWRAATVKPCYTSELIDNFARAIEAKLKEKNSAT